MRLLKNPSEKFSQIVIEKTAFKFEPQSSIDHWGMVKRPQNTIQNFKQILFQQSL